MKKKAKGQAEDLLISAIMYRWICTNSSAKAIAREFNVSSDYVKRVALAIRKPR